MIEGKIQLCRQHWQQLEPHTKDRPTANHLLAAVEIAERLIRENNKLEMENRKYRLRETRKSRRAAHGSAAHVHFEITTREGNRAMINGDPHMPETTMRAIATMIERWLKPSIAAK